MTPPHFGTRKRLATSALLLASFLEVCGCNPVRDCAELRSTVIASIPWADLMKQCEQCLSASEIAKIADVGGGPRRAQLPGELEADKTVQQALRDGEELSFYLPGRASPEASIADSAPLGISLLLDTKPVQWPIPESVYFLYSNAPAGDESGHRISNATAFVISVPGRDQKRSSRFLVTARHIVDPQWAHCQQSNPGSIQIRLNRRTGGTGYETIRLNRLFTPDDGVADLAVIPLDTHLIPNLDDYKFIDVPFSMLPTDAELKALKSDQQVMTAGLRTGPPIEAGNYPVFDPGILSKPIDATVGVRCASQLDPKPLHVWFIQAAIPQGVSGAPVYTEMERGKDGINTPILLGVQAVSWPERGIAGITPSVALESLINSALRESRPTMKSARGAVR